MIYLDNAATTKALPEVVKEYNKYAEELFFNPSAIYHEGVSVKADIEDAKNEILKVLGTNKGNIIFTSSATESNNLAIFGSYRSNFKKVIFSVEEHPSVYNVALELKNRNVNVDFCPLSQNGQVDYDKLEQMLDENVGLISIMHVNNETGAINDLKKIYDLKMKKCPKAIFHVDGVQAFSKIKINLDYFGVDLYTISGHKIFGPKGISALFVKNGIVLKPIMFGGGQENNLRSGTENVPAIMGLKVAVQSIGDIKKHFEYVKSLKDKFIENLNGIACTFNTTNENSPYVLSISFKGVKGETLVHMMEQYNILISTGSACSSKKAGNRVLEALGVNHNDIIGSIRISFSRFNTIEEVDFASKMLKKCYLELIEKLR